MVPARPGWVLVQIYNNFRLISMIRFGTKTIIGILCGLAVTYNGRRF
jgi:hypothetical protein